MKTQRREPQNAEAFPLVSWQDAAVALKRFATERVNDLKLNMKVTILTLPKSTPVKPGLMR